MAYVCVCFGFVEPLFRKKYRSENMYSGAELSEVMFTWNKAMVLRIEIPAVKSRASDS